MTALLVILCLASFIYSVWQNQKVHLALIGSFPPEFDNEMIEKVALHAIALRSSTPLRLQADYVKSVAAFAVTFLCFSLSLFSAGEVVGGWLGLIWFFAGAVGTIKSWRTYKENRIRQSARDDKEK